MTTSDWKKVFVQLRAKPLKFKKYIKHNAPKERSTGLAKYRCLTCGRYGAHIHKYGLHLCRCCFREHATIIGFTKYD